MTELLFSQVIYPILLFHFSHRGVSSKAFHFPKAEPGYILLKQETTNSCGDSGGPATGSKVLPWSLSQNRAWHVYSSTRIWPSYNSDTGVSITVAPKVPSWGVVGIKHTDNSTWVLCGVCLRHLRDWKAEAESLGGRRRAEMLLQNHHRAVKDQADHLGCCREANQSYARAESSLQSSFSGQSPSLITEIKATKRIHHALLFEVSVSHLLT